MERKEIIQLLQVRGKEQQVLFNRAALIKKEHVGNKVYFRGLIEFSNVCEKNCLYCGIARDVEGVNRYNVDDELVVKACRYAWEQRLGSVVLQSGEIASSAFTQRVGNLLQSTKKVSNSELGITLSCGEQSFDTFKYWHECGADRYLLRIESSNKDLYYKIHPQNELHSYKKRLESIRLLRENNYQVGTGVMIGLPFQTYENLADDLLFLKKLDIDMCGMGPYLEHENTPLYQYRHLLLPKSERLELSLNMIALLRILMPTINIAASTALQTIDEFGREKALAIGANVVMPNLTPATYRKAYQLYNDKPFIDEDAVSSLKGLQRRIKATDNKIGYCEQGNSLHYINRKQNR